jgi:hypothetical protein
MSEHDGVHLDPAYPMVGLKLGLLESATPASSAIVFGDMYGVEGAYTRRCLELGCERVVLIDTLETPGWQRTRLAHPQLDFYKGDFGSAAFMGAISEHFELGVAFDVLLHQAPLLHALHLMLSLIDGRVCIAQPMLEEQAVPNALVYLPGNTDTELDPLRERSPDFEVRVFDPLAVNQSHWIWGMTRSFVHSVLAGEGFVVVSEAEGPELPNPRWAWWGCVAERRYSNPAHWSLMQPTPGLLAPSSPRSSS